MEYEQQFAQYFFNMGHVWLKSSSFEQIEEDLVHPQRRWCQICIGNMMTLFCPIGRSCSFSLFFERPKCDAVTSDILSRTSAPKIVDIMFDFFEIFCFGSVGFSEDICSSNPYYYIRLGMGSLGIPSFVINIAYSI